MQVILKRVPWRNALEISGLFRDKNRAQKLKLKILFLEIFSDIKMASSTDPTERDLKVEHIPEIICEVLNVIDYTDPTFQTKYNLFINNAKSIQDV